MYTKKPLIKGLYVCVVLLLLGAGGGVALISIVSSGASIFTTTTTTNYFFSSFIPPAYAHFEHLTHYNTGGIGVGKYYVNEAVEPEYIRPGEPGKILFSIQDYNSNDVYNVDTMIEIYSDNTGERLKLYPWTHQAIGDFAVYYTFPNKGNYQIVLSIGNANSRYISSGGDNNIADEPPRTTLGSTLNCNCDRGIFNISVSENFGAVFNTAIIGGIISIISVFGAVLGLTYRNRKKISSSIIGSDYGQQYSRRGLVKEDILKYSVMLLAIAAGVIHISIFSEHGSLRIEYSIFLIAAGSSQVAYGILYVLLTLTESSSSNSSSKKMIIKKGDGDNNDNDDIAESKEESAKAYYRKSVIINLFGLAGSAVLLLLYIYAVTFPPPLSPNNKPEDVDFAGILDKSLELFLVVGIIQLMRWEKKKLQSQLVHIQ
jgi:hypothetical protein